MDIFERAGGRFVQPAGPFAAIERLDALILPVVDVLADLIAGPDQVRADGEEGLMPDGGRVLLAEHFSQGGSPDGFSSPGFEIKKRAPAVCGADEEGICRRFKEGLSGERGGHFCASRLVLAAAACSSRHCCR